MEKLIPTKGLIEWADAQVLINKYLNDHHKPHSDTNSMKLESFCFPKELLNKILASGADKIHFVFGYHTPNTMYGASRDGYTIVALGLKKVITGDDIRWDLMVGENDIIWDAIIPDDYTVNNQNISLANLKEIIQNYNTEDRVMTTTYEDDDGNDTLVTLNGNSFPKHEIAQITSAAYNSSKIECILAYHDTLANDTNQRGYTLIILGVNSQGRMVDSNRNQFVFDFCEPCPNVCPDNIAILS